MSKQVDVYIIPCSDLYVNLGRLHSSLGGKYDDTSDFKRRADVILNRCGVFAGEHYILVNNEFVDRQNPFWQLMNQMSAEFPTYPDQDGFYNVVLAHLTPSGITRVVGES